MRILFTFAGGMGHFEPLLPLARAARDAGHIVAFVCRPWTRPKVIAAGFDAFAAGTDRGLTPTRVPLAAVNIAREIAQVGAGFGRRIARERAADLLPLCAAWRPDLCVCEELDFGAMVVAEQLGVPHATVLVIASGALIRREAVAEPLNEVRAAHGLAPDPDLAMLHRYLVLAPFPPSFRDPAFPLPPTAHSIRPTASADDAAPPWLAQLPPAPLVYFTLGTVFPLESGDLFARVIAGLRELPINLIVTVGREIEPAEFGAQPANVRIEQFIPQAALLPHCALVVSHGGSGSVMGALAHGLPMVLIPLGADQPLNAERCLALGVARVLDALTATPTDARAAVMALLSEARYRQAAARMQAEIAALPPPETAVTLLERVVVDKRAIVAG